MDRLPFTVPDSTTALGGLTPERFLAEYWQKKPLLIRQAFPGLVNPLEPDELAGLACEPEIESRVVLEQGESGPWELQRGPFAEDHFQQLPPERWTLLVQDVEKHVPVLAELLAPFRFVPDWRVDDLMISFAAPGGSVGPHVDQYDVFLLQTQGRRRWQIQYPPPRQEKLIPGLELRILAEFDASDEWVLEPGDMLYLPPGVPHFGVALDACMTYSVGFRAPSELELTCAVVDRLLEAVPTEPRFGDPQRRLQENPGELAPDDRHALREIVRRRLNADDALLDRLIASALTEPKPAFIAKPEPEPLSSAALAQELRRGLPLRRNPASRFAYVATEDGGWLFVDGEETRIAAAVAPFAARLARETLLVGLDVDALPRGGLELLAEQYARGHWLAEE